MGYYNDDPAKDRRISRLSLISSAAALAASPLYPQPPAGETHEEIVLRIATGWEKWVTEHDQAAPVATPAAPTSTPSTSALSCEQCGRALEPVSFKNGSEPWTILKLAENSRRKHNKVLCKTHYFEAGKA